MKLDFKSKEHDHLFTFLATRSCAGLIDLKLGVGVFGKILLLALTLELAKTSGVISSVSAESF